MILLLQNPVVHTGIAATVQYGAHVEGAPRLSDTTYGAST